MHNQKVSVFMGLARASNEPGRNLYQWNLIHENQWKRKEN